MDGQEKVMFLAFKEGHFSREQKQYAEPLGADLKS